MEKVASVRTRDKSILLVLNNGKKASVGSGVVGKRKRAGETQNRNTRHSSRPADHCESFLLRMR